MRVALNVAALIVASISALTTPSQASPSCMSKNEARRHYGSAHIYWHGPHRCWDATPGRHRGMRKRHSDINRQVRPARERSDWRQARSEMLPEDTPVAAPATRAADPAENTNWQHRWIDIAQVVPRPRAEPQLEPGMATSIPVPVLSQSGGMPHVVVILAFFAFLLIFATIEILLRNDRQQK